MRLLPPEPTINLYHDGFDEEDIFNRRKSGESLSELVEKIEDPMVVAVDGAWGSGKSSFLKRWVGAHSKDFGGLATTVYFDAFAHDYLDDPLIALTNVIGRRLPIDEKGRTWKSLKDAAFVLARPITRVAVAFATSGASELVGPMLEAAVDVSGDEVNKAAESFWKREEGKHAAMEQLHAALISLTRSTDEDLQRGIKPKPLVIVIDELDRCRPDYALSVLEIIKHFFTVPRVHFVLGVNLSALEQSVIARYGAKIDAADYLKRFITLSMKLPQMTTGRDRKLVSLAYFDVAAKEMELPVAASRVAREHLQLFCKSQLATMRDVNRLLTNIAILPRKGEYDFAGMTRPWQHLTVSMLFLKCFAPEIYANAKRKFVSVDDMRNFYGITGEMLARHERDHWRRNNLAVYVVQLWTYIVTNNPEDKEISDNLPAPPMLDPKDLPQDVATSLLETFDANYIF